MLGNGLVALGDDGLCFVEVLLRFGDIGLCLVNSRHRLVALLGNAFQCSKALLQPGNFLVALGYQCLCVGECFCLSCGFLLYVAAFHIAVSGCSISAGILFTGNRFLRGGVLRGGCFFRSRCLSRGCFLGRLFRSRSLFLLRGCWLLGNLSGLLLFFCHNRIVFRGCYFYCFRTKEALPLGCHVPVLGHHQVAFALGDGCFLLLIQRGEVFLFLRLASCGWLVGDDHCVACCRQRSARQIEYSLDGTAVITHLIHQRAHHLVGIEGLTRQVFILYQWPVLAHRLAELLAQPVQFGLQFLRLAVGSLAVFRVLVGRGHAYQFDISVAVLIHRVVRHSPESAHRADAAHCVTSVHHDGAIAQRSDQLASRAAQPIHPCHRRLALLAAVGNRLFVVDACRSSAAGRVDDEDVPLHLRNGVGIQDLVAVVF